MFWIIYHGSLFFGFGDGLEIFTVASVAFRRPRKLCTGLDWTGLAFRLFIMSLMALMTTGDWALSDWLDIYLCWSTTFDRAFLQKFDWSFRSSKIGCVWCLLLRFLMAWLCDSRLITAATYPLVCSAYFHQHCVTNSACLIHSSRPGAHDVHGGAFLQSPSPFSLFLMLS